MPDPQFHLSESTNARTWTPDGSAATAARIVAHCCGSGHRRPGATWKLPVPRSLVLDHDNAPKNPSDTSERAQNTPRHSPDAPRHPRLSPGHPPTQPGPRWTWWNEHLVMLFTWCAIEHVAPINWRWHQGLDETPGPHNEHSVVPNACGRLLHWQRYQGLGES